MKKYYPLVVFSALLILCGRLSGQGKAFVNNDDIFGTRVFVENRGQFDSWIKSDEKILYMYNHGEERIYFTSKGLIYELVEQKLPSEEERERQEELEREGKGAEGSKAQPRTYYVHMNWLQAGDSVEVSATEKQAHYLTYGDESLNSATYKKLTYKNVYPGIDIEYVIPEDKHHGIKYNVILQPGANPADIRIAYSGDVQKIKLKDGNAVVKTPLNEIVEHEPKSFYTSGEEIGIKFELKDGVIGFAFHGAYDAWKAVVIDPWVSTLSASTGGYGFNVDYDFAGNTYVYGSAIPLASLRQVAKYNTSGSLVWTFSGMITSPSWSTTGIVDILANKINGKVYVGHQSTLSQVMRLNASGNYDNFMSTTGTNGNSEPTCLAMDCQSGNLLVLGGAFASIAMMDVNTGSMVLSANVTTNTGCCQDVICPAVDNSGNLFIKFSGGNPLTQNRITKVAPSFTTNVWSMVTSYLFTEFAGKAAYFGFFTGLGSGNYNCLSVNNNFLYFYNGYDLVAYDKSTGTVVATTSLTFQTLKYQGGIAVDDCDNVYLGGNGYIQCYNFNGTSFSTLTPISLSLSASATPQAIYDLQFYKQNNTLHFCGYNFIGVLPAIYSSTCAPVTPTCYYGQPIISFSSAISCSALGTATAAGSGGLGPYSYTWMPVNQTGSVATGLTPGSYTVLLYDAGLNMTVSQTVQLTPQNTFSFTLGNTNSVSCNGSANGFAAVSGITGGSAFQTTQFTGGFGSYFGTAISGLSAGNYTVKVSDNLTGCISTQTFVVGQPPPITISIAPNSNTACAGNSISLTANAGGGTPGYTFTWTNGPPSSSCAVSESLAGSYAYSVSCTDANGCPSASNIALSFVANPTISVFDFSICPLQTGTLNATGASTYSWNGNAGSGSFTANPASSTQYTVVGSALGCSSAATASIILKAVPVPVLNSNSPRCNGQNIQLSASGGTAYSWSGPLGFLSSAQNPSLSNAPVSSSGNYSVLVTALNSCTALASVNVTVHPTPTLSASGSTVCVNQAMNLSASSFPGSSFVWVGPNAFSSNLQNYSQNNPAVNMSGSYSVVATSPAGCTNVAVTQVTVTAMPSPSIVSNSPVCEGNVLWLNGLGDTGPLGYTWSGPNSFISAISNPSVNNVSALANGIYTLWISYGPCIAPVSQSVTVYPRPSGSIGANSPVCEGKPLSLWVNGNSITSTFWTGPSGFSITSQFVSFAAATFSQAGVYLATIADYHGCINTFSIPASVLPNPSLSVSGATVCMGQKATLKASGASSYQWFLQGVGISASPWLDIALAQSSTSYQVVGTAANSCSAAASVSLQALPLPVPGLFVQPTNRLCLNSQLNLSASGGEQYLWQGPAGVNLAGSAVSINLSSLLLAGTYSLTVTDANGCSSRSVTSILIDPLPYGNLSGSNMQACVPFCSNFSFLPASAGVVRASWQMGNKVYPASAFSECFVNPGNYIITGSFTDSLTKCVNSSTFLVQAYPKPVADFDFEPKNPIENSDVVLFTETAKGEKISQWDWYVAVKGNHSKARTASYLFKEAGSYPVALLVQNQWGCIDSVVKTLIVMPDFHVFVPNAFTPNQDGNNEVFMPVTRGVKFYSLMVFDRWGQLLFQSSDPNLGWDGNVGGRPCKPDSYVWKLNLSSLNGETKDLTGNVILIR